jgi:phosphoglycerol transferase MdoB-like AlkP superfamily enzyme
MPRLPHHLRALLRLLLLGVGSGLVFRMALLLLHRDQWRGAKGTDVLLALFDRGLLFDLYVACWMLAVPALVLGIAHGLGGTQRWAWAAARWAFTAPFLLWLFLACADLPYFDYTNMRLTDAVLITLHDPLQAAKELLTTPAYLGMLLLFGLLAWLLVRALGRLFRPPAETAGPRGLLRWALLPVPLALLFLGMRGSVDPNDHPLVAQDAFFSDTPFLNQLGTNATFSFIESLTQPHVELMPADDAIAIARAELGIPEQRFASPIARFMTHAGEARPRNVVLILVESLSAQRLHRYGHPKQLMPSLEQLMDASLVMDRFFSSGMHTANGIFSSLYGLPPIGAQHPMMHPSMTAQRFHGLPGSLRANGYRTCFISPGDPRFDNLIGFLPMNGFDELVSEADFPATDARNSWGVTDHALYRMALRKADQHHLERHQPLFLTLLTVSSHKWTQAPDDIPGFAPTSADEEEAVYEYADRALAEFLAEARTRPWFDSTLFVVVGDHGQAFDPVYEVPLAYHQVPLVIHAPAFIAPGKLAGFGTQVDLPTTILGLLRLTHVDNTLGRDLTAGGHAAAFFCSDHRICAINDAGYRIRDRDVVRLYDHASRSTADISAQRPALNDSLGRYAEGLVQAAQALITRRLAGTEGIRPIP